MRLQLFSASCALLSLAACATVAAKPTTQELDAAIKPKVLLACGGCHDVKILDGKAYSAEKWGELVDQMIDRGARVDDRDYDAMVAYLARHHGPK